MGRGGEPGRRRLGRGARATSSTTPAGGCAITTSTACGWTPCTRCTTPGRRISWTNCPSRWTRCPPPLGRPLSLIAESDRNDPRPVTPREAVDRLHRGRGTTTCTTPCTRCCPGSGRAITPTSARCAAGQRAHSACFHDGRWSPFRGRPTAPRSTACPATASWSRRRTTTRWAIGPPATGASVSDGRLRWPRPCCCPRRSRPCCSWARSGRRGTPWQYFTDHEEPELAAAVRDGRRSEFAGHGWTAEQVPDPQPPGHRGGVPAGLGRARQGTARRDAGLAPRVADAASGASGIDRPRLDRVRVDHGESWLVVHRGGLRVAANLGPVALTVKLGTGRLAPGHILLASDPSATVEGEELSLPPRSLAVVRLGPAALRPAAPGSPAGDLPDHGDARPDRSGRAVGRDRRRPAGVMQWSPIRRRGGRGLRRVRGCAAGGPPGTGRSRSDPVRNPRPRPGRGGGSGSPGRSAPPARPGRRR